MEQWVVTYKIGKKELESYSYDNKISAYAQRKRMLQSGRYKSGKIIVFLKRKLVKEYL